MDWISMTTIWSSGPRWRENFLRIAIRQTAINRIRPTIAVTYLPVQHIIRIHWIHPFLVIILPQNDGRGVLCLILGKVKTEVLVQLGARSCGAYDSWVNREGRGGCGQGEGEEGGKRRHGVSGFGGGTTGVHLRWKSNCCMVCMVSHVPTSYV